MERPRAYAATIEVTFDAWGDENPRTIAKTLASVISGSRGGNCYIDGVLKELIEKKTERNGIGTLQAG